MSKIDDAASEAKVDYKIIDCDSETSTFVCVKKPQDCSRFSKSGGGNLMEDYFSHINKDCFQESEHHSYLILSFYCSAIDKRSTQEDASLDRVFVLEKKIKYEAEVQAFRQSFKETFKKIDLAKSFPSLFEILWYDYKTNDVSSIFLFL